MPASSGVIRVAGRSPARPSGRRLHRDHLEIPATGAAERVRPGATRRSSAGLVSYYLERRDPDFDRKMHELKTRILAGIAEFSDAPVVLRWNKFDFGLV